MITVLDLNHEEARAFFLKHESYFNFDIPLYFCFDKLLKDLSDYIGEKNLKEVCRTDPNDKRLCPSNYEDVNYVFLNSKDGKYAWRPLQIIHPVIYVRLVNLITTDSNWEYIIRRFHDFQDNQRIRCYSIPMCSNDRQSDKATNVSSWISNIEQQSLELALKFNYLLQTDITDCYGSIYTHSISWALHTKSFAKANRRDGQLLGNQIDQLLMAMSSGQTNGIPQGSTLMDFISEIVLGQVDLELSRRLSECCLSEYEILRYRDDYRIFTYDGATAELIAKSLTEVLIDYGMRLNNQKTLASNNVISASFKPDKWFSITSNNSAKSIEYHLLIIYRLSLEHPNSGSLLKALTKFHNRIMSKMKVHKNLKGLISIVVDIMYRNPRSFPVCTAILSKLISGFSDKECVENYVDLILKKFENLPNTGHLEVWLQRLTLAIDRNKQFSERLCETLYSSGMNLWNSDWVEHELKFLIESTPILDESIISIIEPVIGSDEIALFSNSYDYSD